MLLQELHEKQSEIGITDVSKLLEHDRPIKNEENAFFENIVVLGEIFEYFKQCVDAFKIIIRREDRKPFPLQAVEKLIYYIEKCRFLENNVEEEYCLYESSAEETEHWIRKKASLTSNISASNPSKAASVTDRLYSVAATSALPQNGVSQHQPQKQAATESSEDAIPIDDKYVKAKAKDVKKQEDYEEIFPVFHEKNEEEKLNDYIQVCLRKILPSKHSFTSNPMGTLHRMYSFLYSTKK